MEGQAVRGLEWEEFKEQVSELYPGVDDEHEYTIKDLEGFVQETAEKGIRTRDELGEYHHEYLKQAQFLKSKK